VKLELPYPPLWNTLYGHRAVIKRDELVKLLLEVKRGLDVQEAATRCQRLAQAFPFKTREHEQYATQARLAMYEAGYRADQLPCWPRPMLLSMTVRLYRPRAAGDIDGPLKTLLDSLQGNVYENDDQVDKLPIERFTDRKRPRVELEIEPLGAELQPDEARQAGLDLGFTPPAASMSAPARNYARPVSNLPEPLDRKLRRLAQPAVVSNRDPEAA
jgi:Holliday junction resolvase RusA-like endonuclease